YAPERARRPDTVELWRRITTVEDPAWTERYHAADPEKKAFGGHVAIELDDGSVITDELAVADAHPLGERPFTRPDYVAKFRTLADGVIPRPDQDAFLDLVERLPGLSPEKVRRLTLTDDPGTAPGHLPAPKGLFCSFGTPPPPPPMAAAPFA